MKSDISQVYPPTPGPLRQWVIEHDDSRFFLIGYVILSIVLTIWVSLFWLVAMVCIHLVLEAIKKHHDGARTPVALLAWSLWDIKFDLLLLTIAFLLFVYTSISFGIAGLGALAGGTRALPTVPVKDIFLAIRIACIRKLDRREILHRRRPFGRQTTPHRARTERIAKAGTPWRTDWTLADKLALILIFANIGAMALGFQFAEESPRTVFTLLLEELHPWPHGQTDNKD